MCTQFSFGHPDDIILFSNGSKTDAQAVQQVLTIHQDTELALQVQNW